MISRDTGNQNRIGTDTPTIKSSASSVIPMSADNARNVLLLSMKPIPTSKKPMVWSVPWTFSPSRSSSSRNENRRPILTVKSGVIARDDPARKPSGSLG